MPAAASAYRAKAVDAEKARRSSSATAYRTKDMLLQLAVSGTRSAVAIQPTKLTVSQTLRSGGDTVVSRTWP